MIVFTCWSGRKIVTISCDNRKEALKMIHSDCFKNYDNVVVDNNGEKFNLNSKRSQSFFGIKKLGYGQ